ncbi:MAG: DUF4870 domain-containing protein [Microcystis sp.]|jgi:uncharacterized Tic20 family protein|uniref:DUF4870 domain-containing protein n=5 Tax=Microcystis TaxID=1125 RepID=A0A841UUS4_MICAE|nr:MULTISPECIES: DUF4870 domain-containing protein [Microcystis]MBE5229886.1 DUF4870 domain-containing protein [Microcystis aeruginosa PMC 728.11]MCE2662746.1 DUF4870 domain-containing protein [Microcystis sp. 53602_E8]MCZ8192539.1 DUF4870 domain-containing protein [Microcystis sp. LE19-338.1B]MCZ8360899.1 DUF4870 domain-containing protein [Microcystis sp. LE19-388.1G]MCZ8364304.1 DUF4870 domain-containing protein [Microcystis sp. LE19-251.1A]MDJ0543712.1 DUF4870 domain-containing protein [Mi
MVMSEDLTKKRLLSVACHASIFLSATLVSVGIPLAIYFISDDETVKENAKEALNFHLNMWLYYLIAGILVWVLIGYLLLPILAVVNIVLPILAILQVWNDAYKVFRYPFIFRVL